MLQNKKYQQNTNVTKEGLTTTTTIKIPTKKNVTKEGLPTTTTIKKPIVENQTSGKIKTNVTKEGIPTKTTPTKIPVTPTKIPVTHNKDTRNTNNKECYKTRNTNKN